MTRSYTLGLIGWPLEHSFSPALHRAALRSLGLDGQYSLYTIPPLPEGDQQLRAILAEMRRGSIQGLNVTVPHKENIISLLDMLTPAAKAIGAVNTVFMRTGKLMGDNTDAPGFWTDLCAGLRVQRFDSLNALILGAGGSARAIIYALLTQGWSVTVAARNSAQAAKLCAQLSLPENPITAIALQGSTISKLPFRHSLIVNCTPVGMFPNSEFSPWPKRLPLPQEAALYDLIYNPRETLLVRQAIQTGMAATTGLGMLVEQAALSFEHWIEVKAPRAVMYAALADY